MLSRFVIPGSQYPLQRLLEAGKGMDTTPPAFPYDRMDDRDGRAAEPHRARINKSVARLRVERLSRSVHILSLVQNILEGWLTA